MQDSKKVKLDAIAPYCILYSTARRPQSSNGVVGMQAMHLTGVSRA